jgi:hypothetical protein
VAPLPLSGVQLLEQQSELVVHAVEAPLQDRQLPVQQSPFAEQLAFEALQLE